MLAQGKLLKSSDSVSSGDEDEPVRSVGYNVHGPKSKISMGTICKVSSELWPLL